MTEAEQHAMRAEQLALLAREFERQRDALAARLAEIELAMREALANDDVRLAMGSAWVECVRELMGTGASAGEGQE